MFFIFMHITIFCHYIVVNKFVWLCCVCLMYACNHA